MIRLYIVLATTLLSTQLVQGQNVNTPNTNQRPQVQAVLLQTPPNIDGEVLQDEVWQQVPAFGELWQSRPQAGQPASEKTDIRLAYTPSTLYVAVVCYDSQPDKLVVSDARRDARLEDTDSFVFLLDTYHDGQNGFIFGTNPIGIEYDAQVSNEGQGNFNQNRQQGGIIGGFNLNWDTSWEVKTQKGDYGWSAEFAIPLRSLRFETGENQSWGLNFQRNIRKTNEVAYWAPMPIQFDLKRVSLAGTLTGLNLRSPGNLKLIPYLLGEAGRNYQVDDKTQYRGEVGADIKYSITPSMTLDLTYNTDFAQVEVDEQQVNLDRFNLFFPEKRPFFLENAGQFSVGSPGEVDLFFSRRIGIGTSRQRVPIIGGARLSGKLNKTNVGFLSMFTEEVPAADLGGGDSTDYIQPNNFTVARVNHEFAPRSAIGAILVNRQGMGSQDEDYNRTYAIDGRWGLGKKAQVSGFYAQTATPGVEEGNHAFKLQTRYEWNGLIVNGAYTEVGEGFNPEVGFLLRPSFHKPEFLILQRIRPKKGQLGLLELRPHVSYRSYWGREGFLQTSFLHIDNHWEWKNGFEVHTGINFTVEGVQDEFEIFEGIYVPQGTYRHNEAQIVIITNPSKPVSIRTRHILGGFFGGKRYANSGTLGLRIGDQFNSEFGLSRNDIRLPNGNFSTTIFRGRLSYSFTPLIFAQSLIQYNSVLKLWSANVRFGWLQRSNSGLFLVYNQVQDELGINSRSFTIKYSHVFDILK